MLFNSYEFVFLFFPLMLGGYYIINKIAASFRNGIYDSAIKNGFLMTASMIFYGWVHPEYLPVLVGSIAVNYALFWQMEKRDKKKAYLYIGLVFDLGCLAFFKYLGTGGFVPLGISFYTFSQVAFLMECYRGNLKGVTALSYGTYVSFFPKMIQGPIALPGEMLCQFTGEKRKIDWERVYRNLYLFTLGLFKKVLIADTLGKAVDFGYTNLSALNSGDALVVMLSYTLQLYFDFSGYCDMAMGTAGILGFELPLNFNAPYKAANIVEFWKGWHITLTRFFTKYLYIPLGGNRKGRGRTYVNYLIVFLVSGIWHGTGWQFIVWGMMHGSLYVLTRMWMDIKKEKMTKGGKMCVQTSAGAENKAGGIGHKLVHKGCVALTFLYVNIAWIFFRAPSLKEAFELIKKIFSFHFGKINWNLVGCFNLDEFWYVIKVLKLDSWQYGHYILMVLILAAGLLLVFFGQNAVEFVRKVKPDVVHVVILAVLFVWSILSFSGISTFLYVNF